MSKVPKAPKRFMTRQQRDEVQKRVPNPTPVKHSPSTYGRPYNGYTDKPKKDKGLKDGSCNRTACQRPLKYRQYYMGHPYADTRLYYCEDCAVDFAHWDRIDRPGQPYRCTLDETTLKPTAS